MGGKEGSNFITALASVTAAALQTKVPKNFDRFVLETERNSHFQRVRAFSMRNVYTFLLFFCFILLPLHSIISILFHTYICI